MRPGTAYKMIEQGFPYLMRGTNQQTQTGLVYTPPSYKAWPNAGGTPTTFYGPGMALGYFALHNRAAASIVSAIGVRIPNYLWKAGQWVDATTTYTDDTADAQNTTTNDFPLETTTNNDGYCILSRVPFNAVSINVTTASVDAGTVARAARFSDSTGALWQTAESNIFIQTGAALNYSTGENLVVFAAPTDWAKSVSLATGLPDGYYAMNMRATDAPATTAGLAKAIEIFRLYYMTENVADNSILSDEGLRMGELVMAEDDVEGIHGDALVPLFSTANDMNRVTVQVRGI